MLKMTHNNHSYIAFEASVLAQQKFDSIAIPFSGMAKIDWYLKLWNKKIIDNDVCQWAWWVARGRVENNSEQLDDFDLQILFSETNSGTNLNNESLLKWFSEPNAIWLDNLRSNIEKLNNETRKALAIFAGILTGDYLLSFTAETQFLQRPLSEVFIEMLKSVNQIIDNQSYNRSANLTATEFITHTKADLLYANLPSPGSMVEFLNSSKCWREAWVQGHYNFYNQLLNKVSDSPSAMVTSKEHYLQLFSQFLEKSKDIPIWAIAFLGDLPLSLTEMTDEIKKHRSIKTTYLKDFSELIGERKFYIVITNPI